MVAEFTEPPGGIAIIRVREPACPEEEATQLLGKVE
jgi:hypothetical protein